MNNEYVISIDNIIQDVQALRKTFFGKSEDVHKALGGAVARLIDAKRYLETITARQ